MQTKFRDSLDDLLPDDDPGPTPRPVDPGSRLGIAVEDLVDLFREAAVALDQGRLSAACEPVRRLRIWGFNIRWTPAPTRGVGAPAR